MDDLLRLLLVIAGAGQIALVVALVSAPKVLNWKRDTAKLRPLTRQIFWTYAHYIGVTNLCIGLLSLFGSNLLIEHTPLSAIVSEYIFVYWTARLTLQFTYYDRSDRPQGAFYTVCGHLIELLFVILVITYGLLLYTHIAHYLG